MSVSLNRNAVRECPVSGRDLRSVGCTIIELLTGDPPYFELAPVSAMFRIVSDEQPPLPEGTSPVRGRGAEHVGLSQIVTPCSGRACRGLEPDPRLCATF